MSGDPPRAALVLGPAGLIPFVGLAVAAWVAPAGWVAPAAAAYGATILAFLGAVHWGLALRPLAGEAAAEWPRLGLGVVPALVAASGRRCAAKAGQGGAAIGFCMLRRCGAV